MKRELRVLDTICCIVEQRGYRLFPSLLYLTVYKNTYVMICIGTSRADIGRHKEGQMPEMYGLMPSVQSKAHCLSYGSPSISIVKGYI